MNSVAGAQHGQLDGRHVNGMQFIKQENADIDKIRLANGTALSQLPHVSDQRRMDASHRTTEDIIERLQLGDNHTPLNRLLGEWNLAPAVTILSIALHYTTDTIATYVGRHETAVLEVIAQAMIRHGDGNPLRVASLIALHDEFTSRHGKFCENPGQVTCCLPIEATVEAASRSEPGTEVKPKRRHGRKWVGQRFTAIRETSHAMSTGETLATMDSRWLWEKLQLKITPMGKLGSHPLTWTAETLLAVSLHYTLPVIAEYCHMEDEDLTACLDRAANAHATNIGLDADDLKEICKEYRFRHHRTENLPHRVRCCHPTGGVCWDDAYGERLAESKEKRILERPARLKARQLKREQAKQRLSWQERSWIEAQEDDQRARKADRKRAARTRRRQPDELTGMLSNMDVSRSTVEGDRSFSLPMRVKVEMTD